MISLPSGPDYHDNTVGGMHEAGNSDMIAAT